MNIVFLTNTYLPHVGGVAREGMVSIPLTAEPTEASWSARPVDQSVDLLQDVTFSAALYSPAGAVTYRWTRTDAPETLLSANPSFSLAR